MTPDTKTLVNRLRFYLRKHLDLPPMITEAAEAAAERLNAQEKRIQEQDERIDWLETQREVECQQKTAALSETREVLAEKDQLLKRIGELEKAESKLAEATKLLEKCGKEMADLRQLKNLNWEAWNRANIQLSEGWRLIYAYEMNQAHAWMTANWKHKPEDIDADWLRPS